MSAIHELVPGVGSASALHRLTSEQLLPVSVELATLFRSGGLRRGTTVVVRGSDAVMLRVIAAATTAGSWAAVVGIPELGIAAAEELGVAIDRLALVPRPGGDPGSILAALMDGMDVIVLDSRRVHITEYQARRLAARARNRAAVLVIRGDWPSADLELSCSASRWTGLAAGHGYLRSRHLMVSARGRGVAARPVSTELTLWGDRGDALCGR